MVKKEHVGITSIPGPQSRFDVNKEGMFDTYIGHDVPNLAPVTHKGTSSVWRSCRHFLIHSFIVLWGIFFLRSHGNLSSDNIVQCSTSDTILGGNILPDILQGPWPIFIVDLSLLSCLLEDNLVALLVPITANKH
jgi:hypothetical protein